MSLTYYLITAIIILLLVIWILIRWIKKIKGDYLVLNNSKISQSVRYGKLSEQFLPFLENYPYDSSKFRFIGTPVDGVQFEENKVVLVEFKTADSKLSQKQKHIKNLVEEGKVEFLEYNLRENSK